MLSDTEINDAIPLHEVMDLFWSCPHYHPEDMAKIIIQLGKAVVAEGKARLKRSIQIEAKLKELVGKEVVICGPYCPEIRGKLAYRPNCYYLGDVIIWGEDAVQKMANPDAAMETYREIVTTFDDVEKIGLRRITLR